MKYYNQFIKFVFNNYKYFLFISVFYSLRLLVQYFTSFEQELQSFEGRMIGEATLQGYDINKRIKIFYQAGALFLLSTLFISICFCKVSSYFKDFFKAPEIQIVNYTSLAGIVIYFFSLWDSPVKTSIELVFCIQILSITIYILKLFLKKNTSSIQSITFTFYSIAFVLGFSVFFIWNEVAVLFDILPEANILNVVFITVLISFFATLQIIKNKNLEYSEKEINKLAYLLLPIALFPLLSVFKDEIYLILNRHSIYFFSPRKLYIIGAFFLFISVVWRYRIILNNPIKVLAKSTKELISKRYFPLLILGLSTYTFYSPFTQASTEMFESGNRFLPLMEFQQFGVIPIFEKFNSHALSELFYGIIYTFFNGLNSREILIYDFMNQVTWALIVYWLMNKICGNAYIALFVVFLFPISEYLLPDYSIIAICAIVALNKVIGQTASLKNYLLLIACGSFLILWRIDIGYPSIVAIIGTLLIYSIDKKLFSVDWKTAIVAIVIVAVSIVGLLIGISIWRNINVFNKLLNGLNYLASAQTYGHVSLGDINASQFKIHYFVFPVIMILGVCVLLVCFKELTISKSQQFIYTSLIFLVIYYFVNFQRGLVRHSFIEGHDNSLSSFAFFIFSASTFLFFHKKSEVFKFIAFIVCSVFLLMNYKYPVMFPIQNVYSKTYVKAEHFVPIKPSENLVRCIGCADFESVKYNHFKKIISSELSDNQTFIDFSNTPMLYYFTNKISPSYFYQNPLTIHNDYLQKNFISELKNYDAPLIVFSNFPQNWWDNVDGVPNTMRHYRMAEHFYTNYKPFIIVDSLCVWKRNDSEIKNEQRLIYSYDVRISDSSKSIAPIKRTIENSENKNYLFKIKYNRFVKKKNQLFAISLSNRSEDLSPCFIDEKNHVENYIFKTSESTFSFQIKNTDTGIETINLYECEHSPDFYSLESKIQNINKLPYVWATFDKTIHDEKVLVNLLSEVQIIAENTIEYFNLPITIDKTTGNTILTSLECDNETPLTIELLYGSDKKAVKGTFVFTVPPGNGKREFAVRISSQYNWFALDNNYIALNNKNTESVKVNSIKLLKGN